MVKVGVKTILKCCNMKPLEYKSKNCLYRAAKLHMRRTDTVLIYDVNTMYILPLPSVTVLYIFD